VSQWTRNFATTGRRSGNWYKFDTMPVAVTTYVSKNSAIQDRVEVVVDGEGFSENRMYKEILQPSVKENPPGTQRQPDIGAILQPMPVNPVAIFITQTAQLS
jgi:hypothetical protein